MSGSNFNSDILNCAADVLPVDLKAQLEGSIAGVDETTQTLALVELLDQPLPADRNPARVPIQSCCEGLA